MKPDLWTSNDESAWRRKIGMPKSEDWRPPKERNVYLRRLKGLVDQRLLSFIYDEHKDTLAHAERAPTWTPIPWICHNLEISHSCLSRLLRELTGLNAIQTYDTLKLEETNVTLKYIRLIQQFVAAVFPSPLASRPSPLYEGNGSAHFWLWLKEQRRNPDFNRQSLAREFNFPSAARFHRAFYFATHSTPCEFENMIIRQAIDDPIALDKTIAHYTPTPLMERYRGMWPLRDVHKICGHEEEFAKEAAEFHANATPLEFPIVLYKKPAPIADPNIIDAVFTVLKHTHRRPRKSRALPPPQDDDGAWHL